MIPFLSSDTQIVLDQILEMLANGEWIEYASREGDVYMRLRGAEGRDELLDAIGMIEAYDLDLKDASDTALVGRFTEFFESYVTDYHNYVDYVVCKSPEWETLVEWLGKGNFFSIGSKVFSFDEVKNSVAFINKFIACISEGEVEVLASNDDGLDYVDDLFVFLIDY